mmetsp:Transcript_143328/g.445542  ORF Transcript_143328/g.445542 Transcript_143328/m.445542 type:complete len:306 (+) Transcript_143328:226-1143(+)
MLLASWGCSTSRGRRLTRFSSCACKTNRSTRCAHASLGNLTMASPSSSTTLTMPLNPCGRVTWSGGSSPDKKVRATSTTSPAAKPPGPSQAPSASTSAKSSRESPRARSPDTSDQLAKKASEASVLRQTWMADLPIHTVSSVRKLQGSAFSCAALLGFRLTQKKTPSGRRTRITSFRYPAICNSASSAQAMASSKHLSMTASKLPSGKSMEVASMHSQRSPCSCLSSLLRAICSITTSDVSMLVIRRKPAAYMSSASALLPQPALRTSSWPGFPAPTALTKVSATSCQRPTHSCGPAASLYRWFQ